MKKLRFYDRMNREKIFYRKVDIYMNRDDLLNKWLSEEKAAHIHGWDFSHIKGRYEEENDLPWDYETIIRRYLTPEMEILDIDTGGGEFLLSLNHPYGKSAATENYPPNVELCKNKLLPLGINFKKADAKNGRLPYPDRSFDLVINRHGDFNEKEIHRVLKPKGIFITEQVGAENDRELVELLLTPAPAIPFPNQYLSIIQKSFEEIGFKTLEAAEAFRPIKFYDTGALVWFAHIIEWEFPGFTVQTSLKNLHKAQQLLEHQGSLQAQIHRILLVTQSP